MTGYTHTIKDSVNCETENCIYYWKCIKKKCKEYPNCEYIGLTTRKFRNRLSEHKQYVRSERLEEPSGHHFNTPGHTLSHLAGLVLEHVRNPDPFVLKAREFLYIQKFDTFNNGLNKRPWVCPSWAKFVEFMCDFFLVVQNLLLVTINHVSLQWTSSSLRVKYICEES